MSPLSADDRQRAAEDARGALDMLSLSLLNLDIFGTHTPGSSAEAFEGMIVNLKLAHSRLAQAVERLGHKVPRETCRLARSRTYNVYEIAAALNCSTKTVRRLHAQGKLKTFKANGERSPITIRGADLMKYLKMTGRA